MPGRQRRRSEPVWNARMGAGGPQSRSTARRCRRCESSLSSCDRATAMRAAEKRSLVALPTHSAHAASAQASSCAFGSAGGDSPQPAAAPNAASVSSSPAASGSAPRAVPSSMAIQASHKRGIRSSGVARAAASVSARPKLPHSGPPQLTVCVAITRYWTASSILPLAWCCAPSVCHSVSRNASPDLNAAGMSGSCNMTGTLKASHVADGDCGDVGGAGGAGDVGGVGGVGGGCGVSAVAAGAADSAGREETTSWVTVASLSRSSSFRLTLFLVSCQTAVGACSGLSPYARRTPTSSGPASTKRTCAAKRSCSLGSQSGNRFCQRCERPSSTRRSFGRGSRIIDCTLFEAILVIGPTAAPRQRINQPPLPSAGAGGNA